MSDMEKCYRCKKRAEVEVERKGKITWMCYDHYRVFKSLEEMSKNLEELRKRKEVES
jgi:Fe-S-cluster-containing dehydrogenase component